MTIQLTPKESENYFHSALCNGLGYIGGHGLSLNCSDLEYRKAKKELKAKDLKFTCYEDVLLQILKDGGSLEIIDEEEGYYTSSITLKDVHERVSKTDSRFLIQMEQGNDDAVTADCILQTVFFGEAIFG